MRGSRKLYLGRLGSSVVGRTRGRRIGSLGERHANDKDMKGSLPEKDLLDSLWTACVAMEVVCGGKRGWGSDQSAGKLLGRGAGEDEFLRLVDLMRIANNTFRIKWIDTWAPLGTTKVDGT